MDKVIPIFFACDDKYYKFTATTLKSIMENANKDYKYKAYILNVDVSAANKKLAYVGLSENFELEFVDVSSYYDSIRDLLPCRDYYTKTTYYRLFIADMFPQYDKAIYIDSDVIVNGDISEFFNNELENNLVGACNEQAMLQVDLFGTYVEKNLGLDRKQYFNAGNLLINCKLFREECVLEQFFNLLNVYECKVTQDEDYLNIICYKRVKWIDNSWNVESFEDLKVYYDESNLNMVHYLMWGKPWRFDVKFDNLFWKYAKMTPFYDEIKAVKDAMTEEDKVNSKKGYEGLVKLAEEEIKREDTFVSCRSKLGIKSVDRLKVLRRIREYERDERFSEDVEDDPIGRQIKPGEVDYKRKKLRSKLKTKFAYFIARKYLNKMKKKKQIIIKEIIGEEHLRNLKSGAVITCNHFNAMDSFAMQIAYESAHVKHRKFFRVIREGNYTAFPGFFGFLMRNCYTLPLASNPLAMKEFMRNTNDLLKRGHLVLVYPEQSMWWNYKKPKPLKKGAYQFAVNNDVPVIPCFITMQDSNIVAKDGFNVQEYTIHISEPIYPDPNKNKQENLKMMMDKNFSIWKNLYEKTYNKPLSYVENEEK